MKRFALLLCLVLASCTGARVRENYAEQDFEVLKPGMGEAEVDKLINTLLVGKAKYANGTTSWTYKYRDANIAKLLHVTFGPDHRLLRWETQWDPNVYSKKSR